MNKAKKYVMLIIFLVLTAGTWILWPISKNHLDTENHENRALSEFPEVAGTSPRDFISGLQTYFNDRLPFKNQLVAMNSAIDYYGFHSSSSSKVIVGKNGWLFYNDPQDGNPIACYKGEDRLTNEQLANIAATLETSRDNFLKEGIEFVIFIAPNKERIYQEDMPSYYGKPSEQYAALQIYQYLKEHTDLRIIYPEGLLRDSVLQYGEYDLLYHKTDTHWNALGAYIGMEPLFKELGIDMPSIDDSGMDIVESKDDPGDLATMLNLGKMINPGKNDVPKGYNEHHVENEKWDFGTEFVYHASGADPRKLFMRRDSFGSAMSDILGSQFDNSIMVHQNVYTNDMVKEQKPDVFILETVERYAAGTLGGFLYE